MRRLLPAAATPPGARHCEAQYAVITKPSPSRRQLFIPAWTGYVPEANEISEGTMKDTAADPANTGKFVDPDTTADGQARARVPLSNPQTLWFNTGTLCNIECSNCYILSSPTNDALVYITEAEVRDFLDQIAARGWPVHEPRDVRHGPRGAGAGFRGADPDQCHAPDDAPAGTSGAGRARARLR
jgi:hypothetical protein